MIFLLLLVLAVVAAVAVMALRTRQGFADANEIIPGVATNAPPNWAGAHSAEAKLHRRIRDAMTALRSSTSLDDPGIADLRADLERHAIGVDERLIAVAALGKGQRESRIAEVGESVDAIEAAVAQIVDARRPGVETGGVVDDVTRRLDFLRQANDELAALDPTSSRFDALRDEIERDAAAGAPDDADADRRDGEGGSRGTGSAT